MRRSVRQTVVAAITVFVPLALQAQSGTITGRVTDSTGTPLAASVSVGALGTYAGPSGQYELPNVPGGTHRLVTHYLGFRTDTSEVTVIPGRTVKHNVILHQTKRTLETVVVKSERLNETYSGALMAQKDADNIISVMSGDEIRSLPNANAAEALARMPGVTAERDEGEGKYVEIRGTPPWFQHVTINGADVPGTLGTDVRAVKLDDVPADLLGSITVAKTLLADMDADAIGGSVDLESKIPEGPPHGYVQGIYGYQTLQGTSNGQGAFTYGGRLGPERKIGFLIGGEYDRTNRTISDVEPSYTADNFVGGSYVQQPNGGGYTHYFPSSWSQRVYDYYRTRYGLDWDADYRLAPNSVIALKGLWSAFFDQANRWETGVSGGTDSLVGGVPTSTNSSVSYTNANRGPIEHTWGSTLSGTHPIGSSTFDWQLNWAGSTATTHDHLEDDYNGPSGFNYQYNTSKLTPQYFIPNSSTGGVGGLPGGNLALADGSQYALTGIATDNELTNGQVIGAKFDFTIPFTIGDLPASFKFGGKYRNDHKGYYSDQPNLNLNPSVMLTAADFPSTYTYNNFYGHICQGCYTNAPFTSMPAVQQYYHNNPANFTFGDQSLSDAQATYAGTEQVSAAYIMQTVDVDRLHVNAGVRVEHTDIGYVGNVAPPNAQYGYQTTTQHGYSSYTQVFPSVQLRYALDDNTNIRAVFSRGIARPNYQDLAPFFSSVDAIPNSRSQGLSEGNPSLQPEKSWNYDLLFEHYLSTVGVIQAGAFYKDISDFYFDRTFEYRGPNTQFAPTDTSFYYVTQNQNGPKAWLYGFEADWSQHLSFLPGALQGIGFDVNWTWVQSRATIPQDTTIYYYTNATATDSAFPYKGQPFRHSQLPRQFPNIFNVALLYDYHPINFRIAGQYTAASIYQYGTDGTSNPASGDTWNYPHWQIDGELQWEIIHGTTFQVQGLNVNNAVFGFFTGLPGNGHSFNNQREYYGSTWTFGLRQSF
jgi:TonB-dependent receptor